KHVNFLFNRHILSGLEAILAEPCHCAALTAIIAAILLLLRSLFLTESAMSDKRYDVSTFQGLILALQDYWARQGCVILQPLDLEVGAGTFHPATFLRAIGPETWNTAYVQPCRRPKDGRYGENPNRLQHYYQFQVAMKPSPANIQDLYL